MQTNTGSAANCCSSRLVPYRDGEILVCMCTPHAYGCMQIFLYAACTVWAVDKGLPCSLQLSGITALCSICTRWDAGIYPIATEDSQGTAAQG